MAATAAPATFPASFPVQISQNGSLSVNRPAEYGLVDKKNEKITLKTMTVITAVLGILFCGFTAAAVLSDANHLRATDISPEYNGDFIKFWKIVVVLNAILLMLGVVGSRRMWLIGSGPLCPLLFTCGFARTDNELFILKILVGLLLAVLLATSLRFLAWAIRTSRPIKNEVIIGPAATLVVVPVFARLLGIGLSVVFPWQSIFSIIAATEGALVLLSIIVLPPDAKSQDLSGSPSLFRPGLTNFWIYAANFLVFLGQLFYTFGGPTQMSQPQKLFLPLVSAVILTAIAFSCHENDELWKSRQSHVQTWTMTLLCIGIFMGVFVVMSGVALLHWCFSMLQGFWYSSVLKFSIALSICMGGAFLVYVVADAMITFLAEELGYRLDLHMDMSGEGSERRGIEDDTSAYDPCPLTAPDSIRVIHLHPGSPNDELVCTLRAVRLREQPAYEALSYCWGKCAGNRCIKFRTSSLLATTTGGTMPSTTLTITDTLHDALICLRYPQNERVLWIDQICINQKDHKERSAQVNLMQDIYSSTQCAIVWLRIGRPLLPPWRVPQQSELSQLFKEIVIAMSKLIEDDALKSDLTIGHEYKVLSERPLRDMTTDERVRYGLPDESDRRWTLFYGFFDAPWFSRVWIIQEVAWPKKVRVNYIDLTCSWERFTSVMNFVESLDLQCFNPHHRAPRQFFSRLRTLQACRKRRQDRTPESLDQVLAQHRLTAATDPRDHIYGLMGLASERPPLLNPDYEASAKEVFLKTAKWAFSEGRQDVLGLCGDPSNPKRPDDLPSWAPDFSDAARPHSMTGMGMLPRNEFKHLTRFRASGSSTTALMVGDDGVMETLGQSLGKVQEVSAGAAPGRDTLDIHRLHARAQIEASRLHRGDIFREHLRMLNTKMAWEQMARKLAAISSKYIPTGESMDRAILRTYLLGETDEILEEIRPCYMYEQLELGIWQLLTVGRGCSSQLLGYAIMGVMSLGLRAAEPLLRRYENNAYFSRSGEYYARRQLSAERQLFCSTNGLIGLAPRWAVPGDEIFILSGGKVPVIVRRTVDDGPYQFIGEAYVHGAMHGDIFDLQQCKKLLLA